MTRARKLGWALLVALLVLGAAEGAARLVAGPPAHRSVYEAGDDGVGEATWTALFAGVVVPAHLRPVKVKDPDDPWFVPAGDGAWRRGPRLFAPRPGEPATLVARPPAGTRRVFALGGSTTFGIPEALDSAFSDVLRAGLGAGWEVYNVAAAGLDTDDIRGVVDETSAFSPAVYVFYEGHNDVGNAFFYRRHLTTVSPRVLRLDVLLWNSSRVYALLREAAEPWRRAREARDVAALEGAAVVDARLRVALQQREATAARFRENLEAMVDRAEAVGARFVIALPVSDLRLRPRGSVRYVALTAEELARRDTAVARGAPLGELRALAGRDPYDAELAWVLGEAELRAGNSAEARRWLERARDWDLVANRATVEVEAAAREVAAARGLPVVDTPALLAGPDGLPERRWFADELHLTSAAHGRLGAALLPLVRGP